MNTIKHQGKLGHGKHVGRKNTHKTVRVREHLHILWHFQCQWVALKASAVLYEIDEHVFANIFLCFCSQFSNESFMLPAICNFY